MADHEDQELAQLRVERSNFEKEIQTLKKEKLQWEKEKVGFEKELKRLNGTITKSKEKMALQSALEENSRLKAEVELLMEHKQQNQALRDQIHVIADTADEKRRELERKLATAVTQLKQHSYGGELPMELESINPDKLITQSFEQEIATLKSKLSTEQNLRKQEVEERGELAEQLITVRNSLKSATAEIETLKQQLTKPGEDPAHAPPSYLQSIAPTGSIASVLGGQREVPTSNSSNTPSTLPSNTASLATSGSAIWAKWVKGGTRASISIGVSTSTPPHTLEPVAPSIALNQLTNIEESQPVKSAQRSEYTTTGTNTEELVKMNDSIKQSDKLLNDLLTERDNLSKQCEHLTQKLLEVGSSANLSIVPHTESSIEESGSKAVMKGQAPGQVQVFDFGHFKDELNTAIAELKLLKNELHDVRQRAGSDKLTAEASRNDLQKTIKELQIDRQVLQGKVKTLEYILEAKTSSAGMPQNFTCGQFLNEIAIIRESISKENTSDSDGRALNGNEISHRNLFLDKLQTLQSVYEREMTLYNSYIEDIKNKHIMDLATVIKNNEAEIKQLQLKLTSSQNENTDMQKRVREVQEYEHKVKSMEADIQQLNLAIQEREKTKLKVEKELQDNAVKFQSQIQNCTEKLQESLLLAEKRQAEVDCLKSSKIAEIESVKIAHSSELTNIKKEMELQNQQITKLKSSEEALRAQLLNESQKPSAAAELENLRKKLEAEHTEVVKSKEDRAKLESALRKAESEIEKLKQAKADLEVKNIKSLTDLELKHSKERAEADGRQNKAKAELESIIKSTKQELEKERKEKNEIDEKRKTVVSDLEALKVSIGLEVKKGEDAARLQKEVQQKHEELGKKMAEIESLKLKIKDSDALLVKSSQELQKANAELDNQRNSLNNVQRDSSQIKDHYSALQSKFDVLSAEYEVSQSAYDRLSKAFTERDDVIKKMKTKLSELTQSEATSKKALISIERSKDDAELNAKTLADELQKTSMLLHKKEEENLAMKSAEIATRSELTDLRAKAEMLQKKWEDAENELKILERKKTQIIKDLQKQLAKERKQKDSPDELVDFPGKHIAYLIIRSIINV